MHFDNRLFSVRGLAVRGHTFSRRRGIFYNKENTHPRIQARESRWDTRLGCRHLFRKLSDLVISQKIVWQI